MASRRDELNAYTFARKRMVGAFLQPSGGGNDEDAPRPVKAVLPSVVVAAVLVAGFGMLGVISPTAPQGWDDTKNIIQGKDSTTRYVVLIDPDTKQKVLHQVLNMASARLVTPANAKIVIVADSVLDAYKNHGPTIGIPYAPDKLPTPDVAAAPKKWSVCDRAGAGNTQSTVNQAVFVAADKEALALAKPGKMLAPGEWLFVESPEIANNRPAWYLVDSLGNKHAIGQQDTDADYRLGLAGAVFGAAEPQKVTKEWLDTLGDGDRIDYPDIQGFSPTTKVPSTLQLTQQADRFVGRLLTYQNSSFYVVGKDALFEVTAFQANMISKGPVSKLLYDNHTATFGELTQSDYEKYGSKIDKGMMPSADKLPREKPSGHPVNVVGADGGRTVLCSTFDSMDADSKVHRSVFADTKYPAEIASGSSSAHVSPGAGLVFRATDNGLGGSGANYLITETGLRYQLLANTAPAGDAKSGGAAGQQPAPQQGDGAQARLGYDKIQPVAVPNSWASLVPAGPVLDVNAATKPQTY
ncbi:type VII secretion protein EccB [Kitasatospora sp. NPDC002227]|uniref:type VII secretion protein EccB n=1 Tax=Kitasatospora sp. NPDC002227 TaxID=3154773 RepID=UPI00331EB8B8